MEARELIYYVHVLRRRWLMISALFFVVFSAGAAVALLSPGIYNSQATILVESQQIPSDLVRSTVTSLAGERIQVIEQRVMTRDNLLAIIEKFGLFPERPSGISGLLAGRREDMSASELVGLMRSRVTIAPVQPNHNRGSSSITFIVGFDYERPELAVKVANELATLILNEDVRNRTSLAAETTQFLEREAKRIGSALVQVETEISEFKHQYSDALPEKLESNLGQLERAENAIIELDREIQSLDQEKRLLEFELSVRASQGSGMDSAERDPLVARLDTLRAELIEKKAIYSDDHPLVRVLLKKVGALEHATDGAAIKVAAEGEPEELGLESQLIAERIAGAESRREFLLEQRATTVDRVEEIKATIARTSEIGTALNVLERKRSALQRNAEEMAEKYDEARLGQRLEEGQQAERFQVIEQPVTPQDPVKPNRPKMLAFSFALALMAGLGSATALEVFDNSIRGRSDLKGLNGRLLVTIPYIVTPGESRPRRLKAVLWMTLVALLAAGSLASLHYFYMPLELLLSKIMLSL